MEFFIYNQFGLTWNESFKTMLRYFEIIYLELHEIN